MLCIKAKHKVDSVKPTALLIAALSFLVGASVTYLVIRTVSMGEAELSFIVGAVLGSQVGAIMHHRQPGAEPTTSAKAILGVVMAVCAVIVGVVLHITAHPFNFVEISVPFAAVGSFVFPFVLFNTMWNALSKSDNKSKTRDA